MIYIQESCPPRKISGLSSFLISFGYNENAYKYLKSLPIKHEFKKKGITISWEIPVCELADVIDALVLIDDITLTLVDENNNPNKINMAQPKLTEQEVSAFKIRPFNHQLEAINFGLNSTSGKWLLLDSMGCGKTNEIIWYAETLKRRGLIDHCLVICGVNAVKQNWKNEIETFSNESCMILGEKISKNGKSSYMSIPDRAKQLQEPIEEFFIITNIETFRDDKIMAAFEKSKNSFGLIAVDEIHKCLTGDMLIKTTQGNMTLENFSKLTYPLPKVLSYNTKTDQDEFKTVTAINSSVPSEPVLELHLIENNTLYILKCTQSHKVYTINRGWVKAKDLNEMDDIKIC